MSQVMKAPESSLSIICNSVADFVRKKLKTDDHDIRVTVNIPAEAAKLTDKHHLNLFFYRFEPSGFFPDTLPTDPWRIRLHCFITAFGLKVGETSASENELRILGEVMRLFHETPVLDAVDVNEERVRLQTVFQTLSSDDLNHIWSTQTEVSYRPSIAYEMALSPIVPSATGEPDKLVGAMGVQARADREARYEKFSGRVETLPVIPHRVEVRAEDWKPHICIVWEEKCVNSLSLPVANLPASVMVWVAGDKNTTVTLQWDVWGSTGWRTAEPPVETNPKGPEMNPDGAIPGELEEMGSPFTDPNVPTGQAVLYAVRRYVRGSDEVEVEVRSNPVLVTLY